MKPLPAHLVSRIPQDVFDQILSHLRSTATFKRFSVVCHAWLLTCRLYLFSEVLLTPSFLEFLRNDQHAMATVANSIRHIVISDSWDDSTSGDLRKLTELLPRFSRLRELTLNKYCRPWHFIDGIGTPSDSAHASFPASISAINLRDLRFLSFAKFQECLTPFAALQTLSIDGVSWNAADSSDLRFPNSIKLHKAKIHRCNGAVAILDWLSGTTVDNALPLQSLEVSNLNACEAPSLARFVRKHGILLQHLTLGFQGCDANVDDHAFSFGSACPNLKSVSIDPLLLYRFPSPDGIPGLSSAQLPRNYSAKIHNPTQASAWYTTMLSTMASPLSRLSFTLWLSDEWQLDQIDWETLNALLRQGQSSPPLRNLKELRFLIWGLGTAGTESLHLARSWIQRRLWPLPSGVSLTVVLDRQTFGGTRAFGNWMDGKLRS